MVRCASVRPRAARSPRTPAAPTRPLRRKTACARACASRLSRHQYPSGPPPSRSLRYATIGSGRSSDDGFITRHTVPVHNFFGETYCARPVHLVVDCSLRTDSITTKALVAAPFSIPSLSGAPLAAHFVEARLKLVATGAEKLAVAAMLREDGASATKVDGERVVALPSDTVLLQSTVIELLGKISVASSFVDAAVQRDPRVDAASAEAQKKFRQISDVVDSVPKMRAAVFEKSFNDSLQDYLMISYLTSIMRTQVAAAETLSTNSFF